MRCILHALALGSLLALVFGCAAERRKAAESPDGSNQAKSAASGDEWAGEKPQEPPAGGVGGMMAGRQAMHQMGKVRAEPGGQAGANKAAAEPLPRKIIYTAEVRLVVDDLPQAEEQLRQLLKEHKGFV